MFEKPAQLGPDNECCSYLAIRKLHLWAHDNLTFEGAMATFIENVNI